MATRIGYTQPQAGLLGEARTQKVLGGAIAVTVADNVTGNNVALLRAPAGFVVTGVYLALTDIDSGTAVLVTLGDSGSGARFVASTNIGQAGGSTTTLAATGLYYQFPVDTDILLNFATQSGTPVAGTATAYLTGFVGG
jgi:hypothetical protein